MAKKAEQLDLVYWINYCLDVGSEHLYPEAFRNYNFFQANDLDAHLVVFVILLVAFIGVCKGVGSILNILKKQKGFS